MVGQFDEKPNAQSAGFTVPQTWSIGQNPSGPVILMRARIAVYDDRLSAPRIIDVAPAPLLQFTENIASVTYERSQALGGHLPYTVIREISENFIHADFKECTVSILDSGDTIRFSDQGPGIEKKLLVQQPGVTSATDEMRYFIRGVGSGFPIVREYLKMNDGTLQIEDNAQEGVIVTLSLKRPIQAPYFENANSMTSKHSEETVIESLPSIKSKKATVSSVLETRSVEALQIIDTLGAAGPTDLIKPLSISAATAYRLLALLEANGLLEKTANRKRILSNAGLAFLQNLALHQGR